MSETRPNRSAALWLGALGPLVLLVVLVGVFLKVGPLGTFRSSSPPVEKIAVERVTLSPDEIRLDLINESPDPVTVAQILVNDAYWQFEITPGPELPRLGRARVRIRYPWEPGSTQFVTLLTGTGVTFPVEIPVAVETPRPGARFLAMFATLGVYVGVLPVFLGLLWLPFLRRLGSGGYQFFLALTLGLLVFLGVDALAESLEAIRKTPEIYKGLGLALIGLLGTILTLAAISHRARSAFGGPGEDPSRNLVVAYLIAFAIGTHNLGEGLAIGGAYAVGEMTLGTLLVLGFMIHNVTEGVAIVAPIARHPTRLRHLFTLGLLAGLPTILGTWTGGFSLNAIWSVLFLAIGAGAVFQVVFEITKSMVMKGGASMVSPGNVTGFLAGLGVMYATGFLAAF